ncbi:MAG TPA: ABC transporter permease [Gemmatimonadaceae bacterium]|jgi:putative ABC transport system permease protein
MSIYRALLHLYPSSFRAEYGDELAATFAAHHAGTSAIVKLFAAIADIVPNALAAHWDILRADLKHATRTLRRSPSFAITAILVVALGVGANTAAFSVADFVLIRPLPFPDPQQLITLRESTPGYSMELSPGNYKDWKDGAKSFSGMSAYFQIAANLTGSGEPRRVPMTQVSWDLFKTLDVKPFMGRTFLAPDTTAGRSLVISYSLWQTQFGSDQSIIGKTVQLDGGSFTVVGVMPPAFHFPSRDVQLWQTLQFTADELKPRTNNYLSAVGRLRPNATLEGARAELSVIAKRLEQQFPDENEKTGAEATRLSDQLSDRSRLLLLALCGASLCILLLACANLANLLLARAVSRERELAVRAALGAGRERIVRQIVTESVVLSIAGGVVGVLVAITAVPALGRLIPDSLPIAAEPSVDVRILAFAAALVLLTGLAFSVVPAMKAAGAKSLAAVREDARSGGGKQRVRSALVVIEVMASVVLLISSGLLVRAMWRLQSVDPGFHPDNVLTMRTALPWPKYDDPKARHPLYSKILNDVRALPGVQSAAYISYLPMVMRGGIWPVVINGNETIRSASNSASLRFATAQYFSTMRIPLLQGRDVAETDDNVRPNVAVVSESFAKRYWPTEPALGKHFAFAMRDRVVVGVVGNVRVRGLEQTSEPQVYLPYQQVDSASLIGYTPKDLVIRSTLPSGTLVPAVRRIVHDADALQPISDVQTMDDIIAAQTSSRLAQLRVLMILALVALVLSAVGIHGLLSFTVSRRSREIGVRMALGAQASQVRRMILREGIVLAVAGVIPGALVAYAAGRGMEALLAGVKPGDVPTFAAAMALCAGTTILGCLRPALRASRVDPMSAIRSE